jgi:tetratricopeptide (TPR) repeat protein
MDAVTPERWHEISTLFERVVDLSSTDRERLLDRERPDPQLRRQLDRLLHAHDTAGDAFLAGLDTARAAALLNAEAVDEPPGTIGRYRIVRRLGGGGMGTVYLARDPRLDRPVAIKLLRHRLTLGSTRERLIREARAAASLDHPNTVPLHEVGETADGRLYLTMAYAGDRTLADRLRLGPLGYTEAATLGGRVAEALAAAHRAGIVHRDVKPSNIILSGDGRPRLVDFGIAAVAGIDPAGGPTAGTLPYMSPEQVRDGPVDHRTDLWSLGVVLYEMLTGYRPFRGTDRDALIGSILERRSVPVNELRPDVPAPLSELVERCLEKDPADRPPGAESLARELEAFAGEPSTAGRVGRRNGPRRAVWLVVAVVVAVVVAGLAAGLLPLGEADAEWDLAPSNTLAVLPFAPVGPDTTLERLGRELVVTLSSRLDGAGDLRVVEPITVLGHVRPGHLADLDAAAALARDLGAGRLVHGRLTRSGDSVRLDAALLATESLESAGRTSVTAPADDIGGLTDSVALGLLRAGLVTGTGLRLPARSALTTSSVDALQAFLDGELAIAGARFRSAPRAFARAMEADSTFWLAYWRYMYARSYHGLPVDSVIRATVYQRRGAFPEADRLLIEARMAPTQRESLALRRAATDRHPTYWPAWFDLGDQLIHHGVFLGLGFDRARAALERAVDLNPRFVPGWTHLFWIAVHRRDTTASGAILQRLTAFRLDSLMQDEWSIGTLDYYAYLDRLARTGGDPDGSRADDLAREIATYTGPLDPERLAAGFVNYGFFRAQLDIAPRVRRLDASPATRAAQDWADALAWAGRGRWDSAHASLQRYVRAGTRPEASLWAYGLAATGAWLGVLAPDSARALRAAAARAVEDAGGRAELAWLDGLVACAAGDRDALDDAGRRVRAADAPAGRTLLTSLTAMSSAIDGRPDEVGATLAELELSNADSAWAFRFGARHPFLVSVDRIAAAHWLLRSGDTLAAVPFLRLHETDLPGTLQPLPAVQVAFGTHLLPQLAGVLEQIGRSREAGTFRAIHAERADRSSPMSQARPCAGAAERIGPVRRSVAPGEAVSRR